MVDCTPVSCKSVSMNIASNRPAPDAQWLQCEQALLPQGWARRVFIHIDGHGDIQEVLCGDQAPPADVAVRQLSGCVIAGIPNLHSHAHQRAMAGLAEQAGDQGDSFWTWREVMYRYVSRLQPQQLQAVAAQAYVEMLESGYTAVGEFQYLHHDTQGQPYAQRAEMSLRVLAAAREVGIGVTLLPVLYRYGGFGAQTPTQGQRRFINDGDGFLQIHQQIETALDSTGNEALGIAPHSLRAVSAALLKEVLQALCERPAQPVHMHIAEQQGEVDAALAWSGCRPVAWLLDNVDVGPRWCLVHATHIDVRECQALARSQAVAGLCPATEANLGDGVFPMRAYLDAGGHFGIGSDSHISISPVEELRWLEYGQRLAGHCRNALVGAGQSSARRLYQGAVAGGAQASGRRLGQIAPGYRADLLELDGNHPLLYGRTEDSLLDSWIFSGNSSPLRSVFVGGVQVVREGRHSKAQEVAAQYRAVIDELMESDDGK